MAMNILEYLDSYVGHVSNAALYDEYRQEVDKAFTRFVRTCDGCKRSALSAFCEFAKKMADLSEDYGGVNGYGLTESVVCNITADVLARAHEITQEKYTSLYW